MSTKESTGPQPLGFGSSAELGPDTKHADCQHRRYTVDTREQTGRCIDCGAEGRMQFVVGDPVAAERERCAKLAWELGGNRCDDLVEAISGMQLHEWLEGPNTEGQRP